MAKKAHGLDIDLERLGDALIKLGKETKDNKAVIQCAESGIGGSADEYSSVELTIEYIPDNGDFLLQTPIQYEGED
jgi:hypothetical protein